MELTLSKDLTPLKEAALRRIDEEAGQVRLQFITDAPGQGMVYMRKEEEATRYMVDPNDGPFPHLISESASNGISMFEQAVEFLSMAHAWSEASAKIEKKRLSAKRAIEAATNPNQTKVKVDWSDF